MNTQDLPSGTFLKGLTAAFKLMLCWRLKATLRPQEPDHQDPGSFLERRGILSETSPNI